MAMISISSHRIDDVCYLLAVKMNSWQTLAKLLVFLVVHNQHQFDVPRLSVSVVRTSDHIRAAFVLHNHGHLVIVR